MNLKDKLVSKLLEIGKKHRILVYPMLALVAVVTAISHAICWGRGNGKKMVASIMVAITAVRLSVVMLPVEMLSAVSFSAETMPAVNASVSIVVASSFSK